VSGSGQDSIPPPGIGRRGLLTTSALLTGVLLAQGAIGLVAPSLAWALEVKTLDQKQADSVLRLARVLYPHDGLEDAVYALVVKAVDEQAADPAARRLVAAGVQALDAQADGAWLAAAPSRQHDIVAALIADPFVQKVRSTCISTLYNNDMAFAHFGYQGEAFSKGGYLRRGFNDLTWLPDPPAEASPAPYSA
jgi:hypothetical protein